MTNSKYNQYRVRTPLFPLYSEVKQLIEIFNGIPKADIKHLTNSIHNQTGTPQNPVTWAEPDHWIDERLKGKDRALARDIWLKSDKTINPRHIYGSYLFINLHKLLDTGMNGIYKITDVGDGFLNNKNDVVKEIDEQEGIIQLLFILSTKTEARKSDLIEDWEEYLKERSKFGTVSTISDTLRRRLNNVKARALVKRDKQKYYVTDSGLQYIQTVGNIRENQQQDMLIQLKKYNENQKKLLKERLETMDPYDFEKLTKELLEAMDYEDVEVTKQSGDKGIDVKAKYQFGITEITEVVQVKRHRGNITRPVLDQLRGALPYHEAIRGTIITTGGFAKGCKDVAFFPGAAPITLIDGDMLVDLLVKYEIGIKNKHTPILEFDETFFDGFEQGDDEEITLNRSTVEA